MGSFVPSMVDLTHVVSPGIPTWDDVCGPFLETTLERDACPGEVHFLVQDLRLPAAAGTHLDAPSHAMPEGVCVSDLPLENLVGPWVLLDIAHRMSPESRLEPSDIEDFESLHGAIPRGAWVLVRTGWGRYWGDPNAYRNGHRFPSVSEDAARVLLERGVVGLGIDTLSPDRPKDGFRVHRLFLGAGKVLLENVANLDKLPPTGPRLLVAPMRLEGATESPSRVIAFLQG